jgi:uncharacterized damage-inducible protein DinB
MQQEAWLSGPLENVSPLLMPAAHALAQAIIDIEKASEHLSVEELWTKPNGAPSVGFHLRHIAGSVDRLLTYSRGENLSETQFSELKAETSIDRAGNAGQLAGKAAQKIREAIVAIRETPEELLLEKREVGRKKLPTNVFGLLFHIAEHTQRHVGQVVTTASIVRKNKNEKTETD